MAVSESKELAWQILEEMETALKPILEKYKEHIDPHVAKQLNEGLIGSHQAIDIIIEKLYEGLTTIH